MPLEKVHFRHCLLYEFELGHTAAQAHRNLCDVFGDDTPSQRQCQNWFTKFGSGDFSLEDELRFGRPVELDLGALLALVKSNPHQSTRDMARELHCDHMTIDRHLRELGFVQKLGVWVPHELTDDQKEQRVTICNSLLSRCSDMEWIKQIVTGDEKWVLYVNHTRKRQWLPEGAKPEPEPKLELHEKKIMLSVFWDYKGVIWFELLPPNTIVNAELYCTQLQKLADKFRELRPERNRALLLHDNARPHTAKFTRQKLKELGWEVLPHAPYSPDLAPSDFHLFRSLSNFLKEKRFDDYKHLKSDIEFFFSSKSPDFYARGILQLPDRWATVVDSGGDYIID